VRDGVERLREERVARANVGVRMIVA